ncbi:hypothetical protein DYI23_05510 [Roseibium polysiphoniae]|uniref:Tat pathway signal sequence domain protein n=1 Tax=Roseibium polysiphoniae TaxID=2571221 RepID=A0A944CBZ5_9HYPH|nr:hypothetical protein [Roseibium polysiphoniae]MBS8259669.1 hypothetical protein [Roseibium polysiphoniae]
MRIFLQKTLGWGRQLGQRTNLGLAAGLLYALATPHMVKAAENTLELELNRAAQTDSGCMLTFVAANKTGQALKGVAYEFVLFDADGLVDLMTAFDFGAMPEQKTVVRQFELAGAQCPAISQILVNGAARCDLAKPAEAADDTCVSSLATKSRTDIAFIK